MAAGASVRDSDFTMSVVTAVKQAAMMGSAITGVNSAKPGRRIMTTPSKPTAVAVQRRARTVSPRKSDAPTVAKSGTVKFSDTPSASGRKAREDRKRGGEGKGEE